MNYQNIFWWLVFILYSVFNNEGTCSEEILFKAGDNKYSAGNIKENSRSTYSVLSETIAQAVNESKIPQILFFYKINLPL